jgi:hypothetical protein
LPKQVGQKGVSPDPFKKCDARRRSLHNAFVLTATPFMSAIGQARTPSARRDDELN